MHMMLTLYKIYRHVELYTGVLKILFLVIIFVCLIVVRVMS
jgi:hypothetical protein